jgi:hypothetical protein
MDTILIYALALSLKVVAPVLVHQSAILLWLSIPVFGKRVRSLSCFTVRLRCRCTRCDVCILLPSRV